MAKDIAGLCAERHFMGSSSSGRFATDRSVRPSYSQLALDGPRAKGGAYRAANHTRYLREQGVVELVLACQEARDDLAAGTLRLEALQAALGEARANGDAARAGELEQAATWLQHHLDQALLHRKRTSQQLRLIGISPKEQAMILAEAQRRMGRR